VRDARVEQEGREKAAPSFPSGSALTILRFPPLLAPGVQATDSLVSKPRAYLNPISVLCLTLSHMMLTLVPLQLHFTDLSFPIPAILSSSDLGLQCCLASLNTEK